MFLQMDASLLGVGIVLNIVRSHEELPVAYFARQLRKVEKSHSATELEALAVVESVAFLYARCGLITRLWRVFLHQRPSIEDFSERDMRLQEWGLKIIYRLGGENANADTLSRQEWFDKDEIPKDILHAEEQNQASEEGG